jgi:hypothetical protein
MIRRLLGQRIIEYHPTRIEAPEPVGIVAPICGRPTKGHLEKLLDSPKSATENPEISFAMYSDFELIEVPQS